jgi:hypothetical protein
MMISDYATDMDSHVEALRSELPMHAQAIANSQDADAIARAEAAHWQRSDDHMGKMKSVMGEMMSCTDSRGNRFNFGDFSERMGSLRTECDRHRDAMRDAADSETRRAEEVRHHDAMNAYLDGMRGQIGTMMGMAGGYSCAYGSHCVM